MIPDETTANRVLVVDDDSKLIAEYLRCLGDDFDRDSFVNTLGDLEKVLFGEDTDERGAAHFEVQSRDQGKTAVSAVTDAVQAGRPYALVFLDIRMPPGIDGIAAAKQIRAIDPNINIVIVTGSLSPQPDDLGRDVPPGDKIFFFKKPFHAVECRQLAAALCGKWHADLALRRANEALEQRVAERTAELHRLAYFDAVTGLPNRLNVSEMLDEAIKGTAAQGAAVVLLDIERFSFLNETIGYDNATDLLRAVGHRLTDLVKVFAGDELRTENTAFVGRVGDDEFGVIVTGMQPGEGAAEIVAAVEAAIEEPFLVNDQQLYLKASIGVASFPAHGRDAAGVFRAAEAALHRSMRRPDRGTTYYRNEMRFHARHRFDMESELRQAIEAGEIITYFQPQICLETGTLAGVEALARWVRPDGEIVVPGDFVPLSEEMGISDLLFESILNYVCRTVRAWRAEGVWSVPVSVNLSAQQLRNQNLLGLIKEILDDSSVEREMINLELTETGLLEDLTTARSVLHDLAQYGVGIHIDDFGTGYSSLSYLAELPVQTLKIDKCFIERLADSSKNARVVQAIVGLGQAMSLDVVAEGVETDQQLALVGQLGCDMAQGFFISQPVPAADFLTWADAFAESADQILATTLKSATCVSA